MTYIVIWLYVLLIANSILYQPPTPPTYKDNQKIIKIDMDGHTTLSAIYLPNPEAKYTLMYFHGNAGDLGNTYDLLNYMRSKGYAVVSYDYPGYGTSTGSSSEVNLYRSGIAVYDHMVSQLNIAPDSIVAYGQSLGASVALDVTKHRDVAALLLESPFITAFRAVTQIPLFAFDRFRNNRKIRHIKVPVMIVNGSHDLEVLPWQGRSLYKLAHKPKKYYQVASAGHNNILAISGDVFWQELKSFLTKNVTNKKANT